jgi:hypothetical protein
MLLFYWCTIKGIDIPIQRYVHSTVHMCVCVCVYRTVYVYLFINMYRETHYMNNFVIQK